METVGFSTIRDEFAYNRQKKCIEKEDDIVILCGGHEGSGKSTITQALGGIDPNFYDEELKQIFYRWQDYKNIQTLCIKKIADRLPKKIVKMMNVFDLKEEDFAHEDTDIDVGSFLDYDEAGTQLHAREHSSTKSVEQVKTFISNRFLRQVHVLNVPKIDSIDRYVRHERTKFFIWVDAQYTVDLESVDRTMYVWGKQSYHNILQQPYYWQLFWNIERLVKVCPPDYRVEVPNLRNKWIPKDFYDKYFAKKVLFNLHQMLEEDEDKEKKAEVEKLESKKKKLLKKLPKDGEGRMEWSLRTGLGYASYPKYRKMAEEYHGKKVNYK